MTVAWPKCMLVPQSIGFNLRRRTQGGGPSVLGVEQVVSSASMRWEAQMTLRLTSPPKVLAYRGLVNSLDGRLGKVLIPTYSGFFAVAVHGGSPLTDYTYVGAQLGPFSDRSTFSDSSVFETDPVHAVTAASAAKGATSFDVTMNISLPPLEGHYLSIGEFLYVVTQFSQVAGNRYTVNVRPPLRVAHPSGALVELSNPVCRMRLATDDSGSLQLDMLRFGDVSLAFVEDQPAAGEAIPVYTGS